MSMFYLFIGIEQKEVNLEKKTFRGEQNIIDMYVEKYFFKS